MAFRPDSRAAGMAKTPPKCSCVENTPLVSYLWDHSCRARDRGNDRLHRNYMKAIGSICQYPLLLSRVEQIRLLSGIGDFMEGIIDKHLPKLFPHGPPPAHIDTLPASIRDLLIAKGVLKKTGDKTTTSSKRKTPSSTISLSQPIPTGDNDDDNDNNEDSDSKATSKKKKRSATPSVDPSSSSSSISIGGTSSSSSSARSYRPRAGTMPHALLCAFDAYNHTCSGIPQPQGKRGVSPSSSYIIQFD